MGMRDVVTCSFVVRQQVEPQQYIEALEIWRTFCPSFHLCRAMRAKRSIHWASGLLRVESAGDPRSERPVSASGRALAVLWVYHLVGGVSHLSERKKGLLNQREFERKIAPHDIFSPDISSYCARRRAQT
jgi:hypothetical protein